MEQQRRNPGVLRAPDRSVIRSPLLAAAVALALIVAACGGSTTSSGAGSSTGGGASVAASVAASVGGGLSSPSASTAGASAVAASPSAMASPSPASSGAAQSPAGSGLVSPSASGLESPSGSGLESPTASGNQSPGASGGTTEIPVTLQPPATAVQIQLWDALTGPDGEFFGKLVDQFNSETPNVQIKRTTQPGAEFVSKLEAVPANQQPQIVLTGYDTLAQLTEDGILSDVSDLATQAGFDASQFPEAIWNAGQWKNQRVGIPIDTHPMLFFWNKKIFTQAGLDPNSPPTDKATFEAAIQAIQSKTQASGYQMVSSGPGANFLTGLQFAALFYQGGGQWTNADYSQATFNSPAGVQAAEYLAHLVKDLGVKKVESDSEINAFQQQTNGMVMSGIWESSRYLDALGSDLGVAPIPQFFGPGDWGGSHDLTVTASAQGDQRAGAYYFIDWFSAHSLQFANSGQVPARNAVLQSSEMQNAKSGVLGVVAKAAPLAQDVRFLPNIPGGGDLLFVGHGAGEAATLVINGTKTAQQALDDGANYFTKVLQENKQKYGY